MVFLCLVLAGMQIWREWSTYNAVLADAVTDTSNLARSLAQYADDTFGEVDVALAGTVERLEAEGTSEPALNRLDQVFRALVQSVPPIRSVTVLDPDGRVLVSSLGRRYRAIDLSAREYFQQHVGSPDRAAFLGAPTRSVTDQAPILTLSRRFDNVDGSLAGVVVATINASYFADHYGRFSLGDSGALVMFRTDGVTLTRYPFDAGLLGAGAQHTSPFRDHLARSAAGSIVYDSPIDGVRRLGGYRRGSRFPTIVLTAVSKRDALAEWQKQALWRTGGVAALIALILLMGRRVAQQDRHRKAAEAALQHSETKFRLLAETSGDMLCQIREDGIRLYASPSSIRLIGFAPEEIIGRQALSFVHPDDKPALEAVFAELRAGRRHDAVLRYRAIHKDGHEVWLETSVRTADANAGPYGTAITVSRDITERRRLEKQLGALARQDGLTAIANRRAFDEALATEWARAPRSHAPLSLLLLDIDHFKVFNDRYGHHEGDACLRMVAGAVASVAVRSGDLAARYGGEEFAVLLPNTDEAGAALIAERARAAVAALARIHAGNPPHGIVTVSVGAATFNPSPDAVALTDSATLIQMADAALYRAKGQGRNRIGVAPPLFALSLLRGGRARA